MTSNIIGQGAQAVVYEENGYAIKAYSAAKAHQCWAKHPLNAPHEALPPRQGKPHKR